MLVADSLLVYINRRRRKTEHCSERLLHDAKEEEEGDKGGQYPSNQGNSTKGVT